jgi:hypothetical protein
LFNGHRTVISYTSTRFLPKILHSHIAYRAKFGRAKLTRVHSYITQYNAYFSSYKESATKRYRISYIQHYSRRISVLRMSGLLHISELMSLNINTYISQLLMYGMFCRTTNFKMISPSIFLVCWRDEFKISEENSQVHFQDAKTVPISYSVYTPASKSIIHCNIFEEMFILDCVNIVMKLLLREFKIFMGIIHYFGQP